MKLYHRTTASDAEAILKHGFKDSTGTYLTMNEHTGVWLSNVPFDENEGAWGDVLLEVELRMPESKICEYEWVEEFKPYREFLMPAVLINENCSVRVVDEDDESGSET